MPRASGRDELCGWCRDSDWKKEKKMELRNVSVPRRSFLLDPVRKKNKNNNNSASLLLFFFFVGVNGEDFLKTLLEVDQGKGAGSPLS